MAAVSTSHVVFSCWTVTGTDPDEQVVECAGRDVDDARVAVTDTSGAVDEFDGGTSLVRVPDAPLERAGAPPETSTRGEDDASRTGVREGSRVVVRDPRPAGDVH